MFEAGVAVSTWAKGLSGSGAGLIFLMGALHLKATFWGSSLHPTDAGLRQAMRDGSVRMVPSLSLWKLWLGFNASHALGALTFGATFAYLSLFRAEFFFSNPPLRAVGLLALIGYAALAKLFWFRVPLLGTLTALGLYGAGWILG